MEVMNRSGLLRGSGGGSDRLSRLIGGAAIKIIDDNGD